MSLSNRLLLGAVSSSIAIATLILPSLTKHSYAACLVNGVLTIANAVGSLLVLTGVGVELGVVLLIANFIAQLIQLLSDRDAYLHGLISKEHFNFNLVLNILDAIPGLGVLSGIFGLMGKCVFDWAFEFGPTSPDRK